MVPPKIMISRVGPVFGMSGRDAPPVAWKETLSQVAHQVGMFVEWKTHSSKESWSFTAYQYSLSGRRGVTAECCEILLGTLWL